MEEQKQNVSKGDKMKKTYHIQKTAYWIIINRFESYHQPREGTIPEIIISAAFVEQTRVKYCKETHLRTYAKLQFFVVLIKELELRIHIIQAVALSLSMFFRLFYCTTSCQRTGNVRQESILHTAASNTLVQL